MLRILSAVLGAVLWIAYPLGVYFALRSGQVRGMAVGMLIGLPILAALGRRTGRDWLGALRPFVPALALAAITVWVDDARWLLALPVAVNVALLAGFGASLLRPGGPTAIERFARLQQPELPVGGVAYCRRVTWIWCGFFLVNGSVAALLAWRGPLDWWALYTGIIGYVLMGALFTVEYVVRKAKFREYGRGLHDRILSRLFPPPLEDTP